MTEAAVKPGVESSQAAIRWLFRTESAVIRAVEAIAALLIIAETLILGTGVVARYVFNAPLEWSDELARFLFLWLSMFGAVLATYAGQHMRLSLVVNISGSTLRPWLDAVAALTSIVLLVVLLLASFRHYELEQVVTLYALNLSDSWRVLALVVGIALMIFISVCRLLTQASLKHIIGAFVIVAVIIAVTISLRSVLVAMGNFNLIFFFFFILTAIILIGTPIAFSFGAATALYLAVVPRFDALVIVSRMDEGMSSLILLSVPLFVLLGGLIEMTGIARALINFMTSLLGHFRAGLAYVLLGAMYLVSGISGAKAADMAAIAPGLVPEMRRRGANPGELGALMAASGAMSETIPPSLVLIMVSSSTNISLAALFEGGLLPAFICALALGGVAYIRAKHVGASTPRASLKQIAQSFGAAIPGLALPVAIRGAVSAGVTTATEVSTVGIFYALIIGPLFYRQFDWRRVYPILIFTASLSGAIMLIIGLSAGIAWALAQSGFSHALVAAATDMPGGGYGFLFASIVGFVILGSVLEGAPAILVFGPLLFPIARDLGVHEVHYALVIIIAMGIGLFTPPFGLGYYYSCGFAQVDPDEVVWRIWPYLGALFVTVCVIAAIPWISIGFL